MSAVDVQVGQSQGTLMGRFPRIATAKRQAWPPEHISNRMLAATLCEDEMSGFGDAL